MSFIKKIINWIKVHLFTKTIPEDTDTVRIIPSGHIVFKYNIATKSLTYANCYLDETNKKLVRKSINLQKGCLYVNALNKDSAIKKLAKRKLKVVSGNNKEVRKQPKGNVIYFKQIKED